MITQEYNLNLIPSGVQVVVKASQYDKTARTITFNIFDGDELFAIPTGSTVTVQGTKPDKTGYQYPCTFTGSKVSFNIQQQMTIISGKHQAEIRIIKGDEILGTANFDFFIEHSALDENTVISETDLPLIEQAAEASEKVSQWASEAAQSAANAKTSETNASNSASTATNKADEASTSATSASTSASSASQSAQSASDSATTATNKATEASNSARSASESANSASASASSASESAEFSSDEADRASEEADRAEQVTSTKMNLISSPISNNILITDDKGQAVDSGYNVKLFLSIANQNIAGFHNSIVRCKDITSYYNDGTLYDRIQGTNGFALFEDLYLGDYFTAGGRVWRIWGFDWFLRKGDTECTKHHIVVLPDANLLNADGSTTHYMNDADATTGGYAGTKLRSTYVPQMLSTIQGIFGSSHILNHRELLCNAVNNGKASGWAWYDSTVEIPSEVMMYGATIWSNYTDGGSGYNVGASYPALPLALLAPQFVVNRTNYWLRDVVSASMFARVGDSGSAGGNGASHAWLGVRPYFLLS